MNDSRIAAEINTRIVELPVVEAGDELARLDCSGLRARTSAVATYLLLPNGSREGNSQPSFFSYRPHYPKDGIGDLPPQARDWRNPVDRVAIRRVS